MPAGRYRDRVVLQAPPDANVVDEHGDPTDAWTDVGTFSAEVVALSGREAERARQVVAETSHRVTMRNVGSKITTRHRLVWLTDGFDGDTVLNVTYAPFDQRRAEWALLCQGQE